MLSTWPLPILKNGLASSEPYYAPLKTVTQSGKDLELGRSYDIMFKWINSREYANYERIASGVWSWFQINERQIAWHLTIGISIWILFLFGRDTITCLLTIILLRMITIKMTLVAITMMMVMLVTMTMTVSKMIISSGVGKIFPEHIEPLLLIFLPNPPPLYTCPWWRSCVLLFLIKCFYLVNAWQISSHRSCR